MTIQWFPGHMTRARREIQEKLKQLDVVIELLDARIPLSSRNPMIDEILKDKPRLVVLNKSDLADPVVTEAWVAFFEKETLKALPIDAASGFQVKDIIPRCKELASHKIEAQIQKGMKPRPVRALIVGIPNVGKSTLINQLAGKKIAATGDRPGITKVQQWIKVGKEMDLLDTPGILWPKFEDQLVGLKLAATGAIREEILHLDEIAFYLTKQLIIHYPQALRERYGLAELPGDLEDNHAIVDVMETVGRKRGAIMSGGRVDLEKASSVLLRDTRSGKLGRVSLERPSDYYDNV
ncbi:ribosome biogenesis GTPase A [Paenibacillus larvae subsp. larvae]|uniref:Ribosome biogenesis GTPase A n=1 Tax=Paenibacillus larvae subsp. larvae TaxID=147375 RepID=A0A2L1UFH9_9BACL|nr:ribosome biogenesis GTPase YlqF [Paenibacillus larvae]AQT83661.1 ribosome biogenesis GTPase YlqF [Paenibacillus larvae subsp. pulvifaciens]AQZ48806.1 ribosome biogenesis GTPase YlqF [Paenibacillus larvae subsp. pulvifaciens]AVF26902.1 ribosome biogenesis GTPase A [Paenibacillus larvae subsp. larvae]AVF31651.1 ribosome biogenesis GTPase A [Paenibacillus larvae subsp. larvae]MBH0344448.1 GTPase [Paenibacillus larvae]